MRIKINIHSYLLYIVSVEEIFAILFEIFAEILIEVFFQIILQFIIESLIRAILNILNKEQQPDINPIFSSIGYVVLAVTLSAISVHFVPLHILKNEKFRLINLFITPIIIGAVMSQRRKVLIKKQKDPLAIDSFIYGFSFTLAFALVRFFYCV